MASNAFDVALYKMLPDLTIDSFFEGFSMANDSPNVQRRTWLQVAAGLAMVGQLEPSSASAAVVQPVATGAVGDFDFLSGHWKIQHRRLTNNQWDQFEGEATVYGMLGGVASVEELRILSRGFSGMGLRLLDVERKLWADYWVNSKSGALGSAPTWGSFAHGIGTWDSHDVEDGKPVVVRGVWDQITPDSCRWYQAVSRDDGKTWAENWIMHWHRASDATS